MKVKLLPCKSCGHAAVDGRLYGQPVYRCSREGCHLEDARLSAEVWNKRYLLKRVVRPERE